MNLISQTNIFTKQGIKGMSIAMLQNDNTKRNVNSTLPLSVINSTIK